MHRRVCRVVFVVAVFAAVAGSSGCLAPRGNVGGRNAPPITLPPPGSVPTELNPVTLPEYVIEPPDVIRIEAREKVVKPDARLKEINEELRKITADLKDEKLKEDKRKELEQDRTKLEAEKKERQAAQPEYTGETKTLAFNPVENDFQVKPDGYVYLGAYGSVQVAGMTQNQARLAIRNVLSRQVSIDTGGAVEDRLLVLVDVVQYNSKTYMVIADGAGSGERVGRFPITGKEFVTDAIANIQGLPEEASKRNIWVARRTPQLNEEQILPVDWVGISQWGVTATNYQLFPGDRVYIKAQRIVTIDRTLGKFLNPVERLFGVSLLGTQTVNQIRGRGFGFGNTGN